MKLNKLFLANYRGFEQLDLDFDDDVTVLAGVNGVGKSGVLMALRSALSFSLPRFTASKESSIALSDADIQTGKPGLSMSAVLGLNAAKVIVDLTRTAPLSVDKAERLIKRRDDLRFAIRETRKDSKEEFEINDKIRLIDDQLDQVTDISTVRILPDDPSKDKDDFVTRLKEDDRQPLAVFYSTARFLSKLPPTLPRTKAINVATAYDKALNQLEVSLNDFANWYRVVESDASPEGRDRLFKQLEKAITTFLPEVHDLSLHALRPPRFSVSKNGQLIFLEQLSDGERGLLALVFDLTRRLAIANPESDDPIAQGVALVLIDEIELHLHPKWQRDVLHRLQETFRSCQFIITTHSPLVLGEVPARCVRFLEYVEEKVMVHVPTETYGLDVNRILQDYMDAPTRNRITAADLQSLFELIDEECYDEARRSIAELELRLGAAEPELTRASSLIRFLEGNE